MFLVWTLHRRCLRRGVFYHNSRCPVASNGTPTTRDTLCGPRMNTPLMQNVRSGVSLYFMVSWLHSIHDFARANTWRKLQSPAFVAPSIQGFDQRGLGRATTMTLLLTADYNSFLSFGVLVVAPWPRVDSVVIYMILPRERLRHRTNPWPCLANAVFANLYPESTWRERNRVDPVASTNACRRTRARPTTSDVHTSRVAKWRATPKDPIVIPSRNNRCNSHQ